MDYEPIVGKPVRFPPGRVAVRLTREHRRAYRALYARYATVTEDLPVLRDRDFDGRAVRMTPAGLAALNAALRALGEQEDRGATAFGAQEADRTRLFKRLQFLS